jgi:hypothetical protein
MRAFASTKNANNTTAHLLAQSRVFTPAYLLVFNFSAKHPVHAAVDVRRVSQAQAILRSRSQMMPPRSKPIQLPTE